MILRGLFLALSKTAILLLLVFVSGAGAFYNGDSNVPAGPPPNYNQIDTTLFMGVPSIPVPPPDSGGYLIYWDSGQWNIVSHIFSTGNSLEQFHGSVLAVMDAPPQLGVNVFLEEFELWGDTVSNLCLDQNDRWGWVQWDDGLYEIWWDVTTKENKETGQDLNDYIGVRLVGCAVDFNLWSSAHDRPFGPDMVFLGADMTRLSDVPGFEDTYAGISDPYQAQAGVDPEGDPNITIFTPRDLPGESYNVDGLITGSESFACDATYGERYPGAFAYEGNGIQFSTGCMTITNNPPEVNAPADLALSVCEGTELCFDFTGTDPDLGDTVMISLLEGPASFGPIWGVQTITGTVCFTPTVSGEYLFVVQAEDRAGLTAVDSILYTITIEPGTPPVIDDQQFSTDLCDLRSPRTLELVYSGAGPDYVFQLLSGPGTIDAQTGIITHQPDTSGTFVFEVQLSGSCGSDTATITDQLMLNLPPYCVGFDTTFYLCDVAEICFDIFAFDPEGDLLEIFQLEGLGTFTQTSDTSGRTCFLPADVDSAQYQFIYRSADSCVLSLGEALSDPNCCLDTVTVNVLITPKGELACPADTTLEFCIPPAELPVNICLPGFSSSWATTTISFGSLSADTLCFTADTLGVYTIDYVGTDTCGHVDTCTTLVTVAGNSTPYITMADDYSIDLCVPETICFAATADDLDFDIANITLNFGEYNQSTGQICFAADTAGVYSIIMTATDACGSFATDTTLVTVDMNEMPTISLGDDILITQCAPTEVCIDATVTGNRINYFSTSTGAYYNEATGQVCFTPDGSGIYEIFLQAEDACDNIVADTILVEVSVGNAPTISGLGDSTVLVCYPKQICLDVDINDLDGDIASVVVSRGEYVDGQICFVPYSMGTYELVVTVTDECGQQAIDTAYVEVITDEGIELVAPGDTTLFLCEADTLCFPIGGIPAGAEVTVDGIGTYWDAETESICFYSDCCLENDLTVSVTTECGTYSTSFNVTVVTNSRPLVVLPTDTTIFLCEPGPVCLPVGISDLDGNISNVTATGGTYDDYASTICFDALEEATYTIVVEVTDSCGAIVTDEMNITVEFNNAPTANFLPIDSVMRLCDLGPIRLSFELADTDGNEFQLAWEAPGGTIMYENDSVYADIDYSPYSYGDHCITLIATDVCGLADTAKICFTLVQPETVAIVAPESIFETQCGAGEYCIDLPITGEYLEVTTTHGTWVDGRWCINVDHGITGTMTIIARGECNTDTATVALGLIPINSPKLTCPENLDTLLCGPDTLSFELPLLAGSGPNETVTATAPAWVEIDGRVATVFVPVIEPGMQEITISHASEPCEPFVCSFTVTAAFNMPPVVLAADSTFDVCMLNPVMIPFAYVDTENNIVDITSADGLVVFGNGLGEIRVAPQSFGDHLVTITAIDECGAETSITITITFNELPAVAIDCPVFITPPTLCSPGPHCFDLPISGDYLSVTSNLGTWTDGQLCFDFGEMQPGPYQIEVVVEGACNTDTCLIDVIYLEPVAITVTVPDTTIMVCDEATTTILIPVGITGDDFEMHVIPDIYPYVDGFVEVTYNGAGTYPVSIVASNACSTDSASFVVNVKLNTPPDVSFGSDTTFTQCEFTEICVPYTAYDAEGDLLELRSSGGIITDGIVCFTPDSYGVYEVIISGTDPCLAMNADTILITVEPGQFVSMSCPEPLTILSIDLPDTVRVAVGIQPLDVEITVSPSGYYDAATGEAVVFIDSEGRHQFTISATAECNTDSCEFALQVGEYVPPLIECAGTVDTLLCLSQPRNVCLPVTVSGTEVQVIVDPPAIFTGDGVCLDIDAPGEYVINMTAFTDRDTTTCQSILVVTGGKPPVLEMPVALDLTLCDGGEVCFDVVMEDAEFDITNINLNYGNYDINTGQICFFADTAGTYLIDMNVADSCGNSISGSTAVSITFNQTPTVTLGDDLQIFACDLAEICIDAAIWDDDIVAITTSLGTYDDQAGQICFLPEGPGIYEIIVEATDQCGVTASDTVTIDVSANEAPFISPLRDTTVYVCYPTEICLDALVTDSDGNIASVTSSRGQYSDGKLCFVPYSMGEYEIILTAIDECGLEVVDTAIVTILTDQGITLTAPEDTTIFLCEPDTLCFAIGGVPAGAEVTVDGIGTWWNAETQSVCFFSDCCLENDLTVSVTTECGTYSTSFNVTVVTNSRPLVLLPKDTTVLQCQLEPICFPVGIDDIDGNIASVVAEGAIYDAYTNTLCFTPDMAGTFTLSVTATDSCGAIGTDEIVVEVRANAAPVISYQAIDSLYKQCTPEEICVPIGISDIDGNIGEITVSGGRYDADAGTICILPDGLGTFCAQITVVDTCGLSATQQVCVDVVAGDYVAIACPELPIPGPVLCDPQELCYDLPITGDNFTVTTDFGTWVDGQLCFPADSSGTYVITIIAEAQCVSDTCVFEVPVTILAPLSVTAPEDDTLFLCGPDTLCYDYGYTPGIADVSVSAPAYLSGGQVCVPVMEAGTQTITLTVSNQCGEVQASFDVTTTFNGAPVVVAGDDKSFVECDLHQICLPVSITDPDDNIVETTTSHGELTDNNQLCFTPLDFGVYEIILTAVDECGDSDVDTVIVTYSEGKTASILCPDGAQFASICGPDTVCILAPITDAETITILPNGYYNSVTGEVCVFVEEGGTQAITIIAESQCGSDTCNFNLEVDMGVEPVVDVPAAIDTLLCLAETDTLRVRITVSGTGVQVNVNPAGYYSAGILNLPITEAGEFTFEVIAYGTCGADTAGIVINATADQAPILTLPGEYTFERCQDDLDAICIDGIFATDAESDVIITQVCGPGQFSGPTPDSGGVCFVPETFGQIELCFEASDGCNVTAGSVIVNITARDDCDVCVRLSIDGGKAIPVGQRKTVNINIDTHDPIGGFDLLIGFDVSALSFQFATMEGGDAEAWEYFTWNLNNESCGSACPSGIVRFVGIADRNNGGAHPPDSALTPNGTLFSIEYQVANDQNLGDVFIPISFVWYDCADNAVSDTSGTVLYIDSRIYNPEGILLWDEADDLTYPESARQRSLGAPDSCVTVGEKTQAVRCIEFHNGGIKIVHPDEIDDRGDVNLNKIAYEIADAVVFTNYFINGLGAFTISIPGQIAATDVNADGLTLTVADLSLLIRVIIGDANPIPKITPHAQRALVSTSQVGDVVRITAETSAGIGAAYLIYDIDPSVTLGEPQAMSAADGFEIAYGIADGQLKILMYDIGTAQVGAGTNEIIEIPIFGDGALTLVHSELVDYQSQPYLSLAASVLPAEYELIQNYPNPFNPSTTIRFALPTAADWDLKVYNITGALVWQQAGRSQGGMVDVLWDGQNLDGSSVASGVYFYRLDANKYSNTKKMILLK